MDDNRKIHDDGVMAHLIRGLYIMFFQRLMEEPGWRSFLWGGRIVDYRHQLIEVEAKIAPVLEVDDLVCQAIAPYQDELSTGELTG